MELAFQLHTPLQRNYSNDRLASQAPWCRSSWSAVSAAAIVARFLARQHSHQSSSKCELEVFVYMRGLPCQESTSWLAAAVQSLTLPSNGAVVPSMSSREPAGATSHDPQVELSSCSAEESHCRLQVELSQGPTWAYGTDQNGGTVKGKVCSRLGCLLLTTDSHGVVVELR